MSDLASKALVLANMIERYNAGVGSQKMCDDYSEAARCLRSQEARIVALTDALDRAEKAQPAQAVPLLADEEIEVAWDECDYYETKRAYFDAGVHWAQKAVLSKLGLQNKEMK